MASYSQCSTYIVMKTRMLVAPELRHAKFSLICNEAKALKTEAL